MMARLYLRRQPITSITGVSVDGMDRRSSSSKIIGSAFSAMGKFWGFGQSKHSNKYRHCANNRSAITEEAAGSIAGVPTIDGIAADGLAAVKEIASSVAGVLIVGGIPDGCSIGGAAVAGGGAADDASTVSGEATMSITGVSVAGAAGASSWSQIWESASSAVGLFSGFGQSKRSNKFKPSSGIKSLLPHRSSILPKFRQWPS